MSLVPRQTRRQTLGFSQIQAMGLLRLTNEGLADYLVRKAGANPLIRVRRPLAAAGFDGREDLAEATPSLYAHVLPQIRLVLSDPPEQALALALLAALDPNGWLDRPLAEIAAEAGQPLAPAEPLLARVQAAVEPAGLFARSLSECLRLQLESRDRLTEALARLLDHLPVLAEGGVAALAAASGLSVAQTDEGLAALRRLDPRPGLAFSSAPAPLRRPDVIVVRQAAGWQVSLDRGTLPEVTLADPVLRRAAPVALRREAEWLCQTVERRNRTVIAVAGAVMEAQKGFLDRGPLALNSLSRGAIAQHLGLHDTTVGRIARDLLIETPHGLRSLCSFFEAGPRRAGAGAGLASSAIRARLAQLLAQTPGKSGRSDAQLSEALAQEGIFLARRTIAKFRAQLGTEVRTGSPDA